jgi:hypothetical protein
MTEKISSLPLPICKAILICDQVEIDQVTGGINLWNVFGAIPFPSFPGHTSGFDVFLILTEGEGKQNVWIEVNNLQDGQLLDKLPPRVITFQGRTQLLFVKLTCPLIRLPSPGLYDLVVFCDSGEIDRLKISAFVRPAG